MVRYCCICKVDSGSYEDISIHTIPKNEDLKEKWFLNIGRKVSKYSGVCNRHFETKDFQYRVIGNSVIRFLIPEAVPTLLLPQSNCENILSNDTEVTTSSSQTMLLLEKTSDEMSILSDTHHQLQANKNKSSTILADDTNTNLQDISYIKVENKNVEVTKPVKTEDNIEQSSLDRIHYDVDSESTILADDTNTNLQDVSCIKLENKNVEVTKPVKTEDNIEQSSLDRIHYDVESESTILADDTNTNLQDVSCIKLENKNVEVTKPVKTEDNIEQSSLDRIHYDINSESTNSIVIKHEVYSEIVNDNCNDLNIIDSECSNDVKKISLKRKSNEAVKNAKRFYNPRFIGDLRREDFTSEISWKIVHKYVKVSRSQCKILKQKVRRLNKKIETFKSLLNRLMK